MLVGLLMAAALQGDGPPPTLDKGDRSRFELERHVVVRTESDWRAFWKQHAPDRAQPMVDFAANMVVGLFLGARNSAGYAIDIVSARGQTGGTTVRYRQHEPARGAIAAQVMTSPYHLVVIPKSSGDVSFERVE